MTKKIFLSIAVVAALVFTASVGLIMGVLYTHFLNVQMDQLKAQAVLAARGIEESGASYTEGLSPKGYRLTWIDASGKVLYDSDAEPGSMENHLQREEVQQALRTGEGESSRYSTTLLERRLYVAIKAGDGSIIRISDAQHSVLGLLLGMVHQILIMAAIALALSLALAYRLSRRIVMPLNEIDLDRPDSAKAYKELEPFLDRIRVQQSQIRTQSQQLRQKQQEFDASIANMEEGLLILNDRKEVLSINRAASTILKLPQHPMGRSLEELASASTSGARPPALAAVESAFSKAMDGQQTEEDLQIGDTSYQVHASPIRSDGKVDAAVIFLLDVSARQREEKMRREFTANVSHELKTPLQTISGSAELIAEGMVKSEDIPAFGSRIHTEAARLITLIDDIIGLSRLDEGAEDMRHEKLDLLAAAEHAVADLASAAAEAQIRLSVTGESAMVIGDIRLLESVVHNLCGNAIKYSLPGGSVEVSVANSAGRVLLTVRDEGIGIAEEEQERIFERFYRVDKGRSKQVGGTGLGLSIVKHAVQLHQGTIQLESAPGKGTAVTVSFPAAE